MIFFFNDTATTEIYTLSLHDALPISGPRASPTPPAPLVLLAAPHLGLERPTGLGRLLRSEEHTSELQSRQYLVCRLLLEKKKKYILMFDCFFLLPCTSIQIIVFTYSS